MYSGSYMLSTHFQYLNSPHFCPPVMAEMYHVGVEVIVCEKSYFNSAQKNFRKVRFISFLVTPLVMFFLEGPYVVNSINSNCDCVQFVSFLELFPYRTVRRTSVSYLFQTNSPARLARVSFEHFWKQIHNNRHVSVK